jgi:hypothetical protein
MKRAITIMMVLLVGLINLTFAQKPAVMVSKEPGWHKIGEITANFKMQTESIVVWGADEFSQIKLRVTDAPINIERLQVIYEDGTSEDIDVRSEIQAWGETRTIDLKGADKEIEKVAFTYKTLPNYRGEKAQVELYGYRRGNESDSYRRDNDRDNRDLNDNRRERDLDNAERDVEQAADSTKEDVKEGANKLGDKISEAASNAAAEVNDQFYSGKMGPDGQNIYIDKHSKYYYINNEGKKVYIDKSQIKDRPKKD